MGLLIRCQFCGRAHERGQDGCDAHPASGQYEPNESDFGWEFSDWMRAGRPKTWDAHHCAGGNDELQSCASYFLSIPAYAHDGALADFRDALQEGMNAHA